MLSDRWVRRKIIALGVFGWSAATFLCGLATDFGQLLMARAAVGIGEAAYGPPANSLLSDAFPALERSRILGFFNLGMFLGGATGLILGGVLGEILGWRACLYLVSLPGFLLGGLAWYLREPPQVAVRERTSMKALLQQSIARLCSGRRGHYGVLCRGADRLDAAICDRCPAFSTARCRALRRRGGGDRGLVGVITGSYLADWLYARWPWGRMATIGVGLILLLSVCHAVALYDEPCGDADLFFPGHFFNGMVYGANHCRYSRYRPLDVKATAQALYILLIHLLGDTMSPAIVGKLADLYDLQGALLLPAVINVVGGVMFLIGCRRVG